MRVFVLYYNPEYEHYCPHSFGAFSSENKAEEYLNQLIEMYPYYNINRFYIEEDEDDRGC